MNEIFYYKIDNTKLLIDGPLGKLARWMRIIGYDTEYYSEFHKHDIIEFAIEEELVIITKSKITTDMGKKRGLRCILIMGDSIDEQITELVKLKFEIKDPMIKNSRCSLCNGNLKPTKSIEDMSVIPQQTKKYYTAFYKCVNCDQFYWEGGHWVKIRTTILNAISTLQN